MKIKNLLFFIFLVLPISSPPPALAQLTLDGSGDYIDAGNDSSLNLTSDWTYCLWIKDIGSAIADPLFSHWQSNTTGRNIFIYLLPSQKLQVDIPYIKGIMTSVGTMDSNWHHVAVTKSGTTWTIYFDGISDSSVSDATAQEAPTNNLYLGWDSFDSVLFANVIMNDARIYSRALSSQEIQSLALSRSYLVNNTANLVLWYRLDDGVDGTTASGATVSDHSGTGNTGTINGNPVWNAPTYINYP